MHPARNTLQFLKKQWDKGPDGLVFCLIFYPLIGAVGLGILALVGCAVGAYIFESWQWFGLCVLYGAAVGLVFGIMWGVFMMGLVKFVERRFPPH